MFPADSVPVIEVLPAASVFEIVVAPKTASVPSVSMPVERITVLTVALPIKLPDVLAWTFDPTFAVVVA